MDKEDVVCMCVCVYIYLYIHTHTHTHTHTCIHTLEYYSARKKNVIMSLAATWIDLEIIILSEVSQTEKDKYHDIAYMWNLKEKIQMNLFTEQK